MVCDIAERAVGEVERTFDIHRAAFRRIAVESEADTGAVALSGNLHADSLVGAFAYNLVCDFIEVEINVRHAFHLFGIFLGRRQL